MLIRARKFALFLLMLLLPLQGLAASLAHLVCAPPAASETMHGGHQHDAGHGHGGSAAHHDHEGGDGSSGTGHTHHFVCHQILTAIPSIAVALANDTTAAFEPSDPGSSTPYFPELPQPVPLA